jgi:hypothetical protein
MANNFPETVSELYPSKWLKRDDLAGRPVRVKIEAVNIETFRQPDGTSKVSAVLAFAGKFKRLICNKTQCIALVSATGSERFADWVGHEVMLAPATSQNGKPTIAILPVTERRNAQSAVASPAEENADNVQRSEPLPDVVAAWQKPQDAYDWAISIGASENEFSARAAFAKAVDAHGGRLTKQNASAVYLDFYKERLARAEEKKAAAQAEVANLTLDLVEAMSPDVAMAQALAPAQVEDVFA